MKEKKIIVVVVLVIVCALLAVLGVKMLNDSGDNSKDNVHKYGKITSKQVEQLNEEMSREEVLEALGQTEDIGSGRYIYVYEVDGKYLLKIPFDGDDAKLKLSGADLLKQLEPMDN